MFGTSLIPAPAQVELDGREEGGKPVRGRGQEGADVVHDVGCGGGVHHYPPDHERESDPSYDGLQIHVASRGRPDCVLLPENLC